MDFKNTIIILTSNLGSEFLLSGISDNGDIKDEARENVMTLLKRSFRPEFLNRLDEIVLYKPLSKENILGITELLIADLRKRIEQKQLKLTVTEKAKEYIAEEGYDPAFGARPLKRFVQSAVETLIARKIISENLEPETEIKVDFDGTSLIIV